MKWKELLIYLIHKKGEKIICENYRSMVMMNVVYENIALAIKNKFKRSGRKDG